MMKDTHMGINHRKGEPTMTKEEITLKNLTKYLESYANVVPNDYRNFLSKEEIAEIKVQKALALEILVRFRLADYIDE